MKILATGLLCIAGAYLLLVAAVTIWIRWTGGEE